MVNMVELEKALTHIRDHPEQHKQKVWVNECGTAGCLAGWGCLLNGWQPARGSRRVEYVSKTLQSDPGQYITAHVRHLAMQIFDINDEDASILFYGENTVEVITQMVKDLGNGESLEDHWRYYGCESDVIYDCYVRSEDSDDLNQHAKVEQQ